MAHWTCCRKESFVRSLWPSFAKKRKICVPAEVQQALMRPPKAPEPDLICREPVFALSDCKQRLAYKLPVQMTSALNVIGSASRW